jgi:uncharacterized protein (TIGR04222 family)
MNPFDLRGPEFLLFYLGFAGLVGVSAWLWRRMGEAGTPPPFDLSNPYLLACLRDGRKGVVEVMVFSLVDRGLLEPSDRTLHAADGAVARVRRLEEEAILKACAGSNTLHGLQTNPDLAWIGGVESRTLEQLRLFPDEAQRGVRYLTLGLALALVLGVAGAKVLIALGRGHSNVIFLFLAAGMAAYGLVQALLPLRTSMGSRALREVRSLGSDLRHRAPQMKAGGGSVEALMLAAMFGVSVLPEGNFPFLLAFRPPPSSGGDSSSTCGSSCGGGCGGGCGGCGS